MRNMINGVLNNAKVLLGGVCLILVIALSAVTYQLSIVKEEKVQTVVNYEIEIANLENRIAELESKEDYYEETISNLEGELNSKKVFGSVFNIKSYSMKNNKGDK